MRTRTIAAAALLAAAAVAAGCEQDVESFTATQEGRGIVNGEIEDGFPSAVALGGEFGGDPQSMCSGNLITPRVIISAAHCGDGIPIELVQAMGVAYFGTEITDPDEAHGFSDLIIHPDYVPLDSEAGELGAFDLSVFVLEEEEAAEPTWFRRDEILDEEIGAELKSVGFGVTSAEGGGSGTKRSATLLLYDYDENFLLSMVSYNPNDANICSGDSGGPQFFLRDGFWVQGAVHSWGDQNCTISSGSTRVDIAAEWILDQIEEVHGTRDVCEINGWYDDGVCHPFCDLVDPDCALPGDAGVDGGDPEEDGGAPADGGGIATPNDGCGCAISPSPARSGLSALALALAAALALARRRRG